MMWKGRCTSKRWSKSWIFCQSRWATERVSRKSRKTRLICTQVRFLCMTTRKNLHAWSNDRASTIVVITWRSIGFVSIRRCLPISGWSGACRRCRLSRGRGWLSADGRTISRWLFFCVTGITHTYTLLTTNTVNTCFRRRSTFVSRFFRNNISFVRLKSQGFPVRRAAACTTPFQLCSWWRFCVCTGIHALRRFIQRRNQRLCWRISTYLTACLGQ